MSLSLRTIKTWLGDRPRDAHKGLFGHILMIGGDEGMGGAMRLSAEAALRIGAGLVTVITHPTHANMITATCPEIICYGLSSPHDSILSTQLRRATSILLGPGLGQSLWSHHWFEYILSQTDHPMILDADGLNLLSQQDRRYFKSNWILTPHPKEAARLLQTDTDIIQQDRIHAIQAIQQQYGGIVLLKGFESLVYTEHETLYTNHTGNPGMASAGMGDVLSGIIAGLHAQGCSLFQSACAGAFIHGYAGDKLSKQYGERGILASDIIHTLPTLWN